MRDLLCDICHILLMQGFRDKHDLIGTSRLNGIVERTDMGNIEAIGTTPEEMAQFMRIEREKWGKLIRDIGAKAD